MSALLRPVAATLLLLACSHATARAQAPSGATVARVTAYCLNGPTRSGEWTRHGVVAVDPSLIPLGSELEIEGLGGGFQALDTGGGVHGAHIDLWMPSCVQARNWGVQYRTVGWRPRGTVYSPVNDRATLDEEQEHEAATNVPEEGGGMEKMERKVFHPDGGVTTRRDPESPETWIVDRVATLHRRATEQNLPPALAEAMAERWYNLLLGLVMEKMGGEVLLDPETGETTTTPRHCLDELLPLLQGAPG